MSSENKIPVSVCLLVKNEADRLPGTLERLNFFSEIVALDSGSTDNSLEILGKFGVRIIQSNWQGFAKTRKVLFNSAEQPWIYWLDADEIITDQLRNELIELFSSPIDLTAFMVNRIVYFDGHWIKHGDWFPDWNVRLFRSDKWKMENREVHESITILGEIGKLGGLMEHYTYRNWEDMRQRSLRYANLWAVEAFAKNKKYSLLISYLRSVWRLFRGLILKGGLLDGIIGIKIAIAISKEVLLKYRLLGDLIRSKTNQ